MAVEITIPSGGESITEVQIGSWLKKEGDFVQRDEVVVEIETDKASMELPAPASGVLTGVKHKAGDIVPVGAVIAVIDETAKGTAAAKSAEPAKAAASGNGPRAQARQAAGAAASAGSAATGTATATHVMPAARRALHETGLAAEQVPATGPGGRLLKEDVQRAAAAGAATATSGAAAAPAASPSAAPAAPEAPVGDRPEEVIPMTMLRRRIAQRLVEAQQTQAQLTTFNEIDMSTVMALRKQEGDAFQKRYGVKLGFMSFFVKAAIDALKTFPQVNGEIRGTDIVYKNYYDVGVAVSTEHGLVVPVLRAADRLSFAEIEQRIGDLATRARDRKITVEELQGGTFTITNGGIFGSLMSTPIINYPQSAILGLHAIQERPVAVNGQVVIKPMMYVALSYDHRIIDGRESVTFLRRIKDCIENPTRMLIEA